ncbi:MAG: F0F1 ATP synthase subunit epsilon [Muribaculaceae bacterium]|nr:F0F1 ATP synthase subunit epsilon [Muribaculaceae bacterium]
MILKIISAEDILFEGEVSAVTFPGASGSFTVLRNHASLISTLTPGTIVYRKADGQEESLPTQGGIADVDNNVVSVCVY